MPGLSASIEATLRQLDEKAPDPVLGKSNHAMPYAVNIRVAISQCDTKSPSLDARPHCWTISMNLPFARNRPGNIFSS